MIIQPAMMQSHNDLWVVLELPKCIVVLSRAQFLAGLKRGKAWRRAEALRTRTAASAETIDTALSY